MTDQQNTAIDTNSKGQVLLDLFAEFSVDQKKAKEGAPLEIGGTTFYVAKMGSPEYLAERNKLMFEVLEQFKPEDRTEENEAWVAASVEVMQKAYAKHILVGWDKLKFNGKIYEGYDYDAALALMKLDDFADIILNFASTRKNYSAVTEDQAKN